MSTAIQVAFGVSSILAGLLVGCFAYGADKLAAETRREKAELVLEAAALAVVALLSVAGGACTLGGLIR